MAKIDFYTIDKAEKEAIFNAIATEKGMTPFAVEKDWWVSRTLEIINKVSFMHITLNCFSKEKLTATIRLTG